MKYAIKIHKISTVDDLENSWNIVDYKQLLERFDFANDDVNAIAGARAGNETMLFANLEKALQNSELYKIEAINDLDFVNYREHEKFISLTK